VVLLLVLEVRSRTRAAGGQMPLSGLYPRTARSLSLIGKTGGEELDWEIGLDGMREIERVRERGSELKLKYVVAQRQQL